MKIIKPFEAVGSGLYTTFPNSILDNIMPLCKPNTWKIICVTVRKTHGWHKDEDKISISQYRELSGISSKETCHKAVMDAVEQGFLLRFPYKNSFKYSLNRDYEMKIGTETVPLYNGTKTVPLNGTETVHTKERLKKDKEGKIFSMLQNLGIFSTSLVQMVESEIDDWDKWTASLPEGHRDKSVSGIDAVLYACEEAVKAGASSYVYVENCFKQWKKGGYKSKKYQGTARGNQKTLLEKQIDSIPFVGEGDYD